MRYPAALLVMLVLSACGHPQLRTPADPHEALGLETANALVRAGCLDCLLEAYRKYDSRRLTPVAAAATVGAIRAAALIDIREREPD